MNKASFILIFRSPRHIRPSLKAWIQPKVRLFCKRTQQTVAQGYVHSGFTLIEILIGLAILALMMALAIPYFQSYAPGRERRLFITQLTSLTAMARHNALMTHTTHKLFFDLEKRTVHLEQETAQKNDKNDPVFEPVKGLSIKRSITWPTHLQFKNFYIEGYDEMERFSGRMTGQIWFFVAPDGLTQDVIINMLDTSDKQNGKPAIAGLVLNPFSARFEAYATFQK